MPKKNLTLKQKKPFNNYFLSCLRKAVLKISLAKHSCDLVLNVVILFLFLMRLPLLRSVNRGVNAKRNFIRHGYLTLVALVLETSLVFVVMIPSFLKGVSEFSRLSILDSANVWSHVILGIIADLIGFIIIVPWL